MRKAEKLLYPAEMGLDDGEEGTDLASCFMI